MFLDLPTEIQGLVYDKLMIEDRIALNKAVPLKKRRYKTCKQKDAKLHVLLHVFKKHRVAAKDISGKLYGFLCENADDPTIKHIFQDNPEFNPKNDPKSINRISLILAKMQKNEHVHKEIEDALELTAVDIKTMLEHAAKHCLPEYWKALCGIKKIKEEMRTLKGNFVVIFNMINYHNIELLKHVVSIQDDYPFLQRSLEEMRLPHYASIFSYTKDIEILLEHVHLSWVAIEDMVRHHALNGDFDAALAYLKYMFKKDKTES